jgi:membrane-bound lytic murein transglycosylase D
MRSCLVLLVVLGAAAPAAADELRRPGLLDEPPGPSPSRPALEQDEGGRRAVRGCPVDSDCRPGHERLRDFELEAFPRGADPWITRDEAAGAPLVETVLPRAATRPSELGSQLAWLDALALPDLPVRWDRRVVDYLLFYKDDPRGRSIMRRWLEDQGRYAAMIDAQLRRAGLPRDLLYVAMIESSYDPRTTSRAGASGLWQFMPAGGAIYGMRIDRWVDERRDPIRSTEAVLDYWRDLHQRFGDWHLALAAYNAGYGQVIRAIARYNTNDFWQLLEYENALPWESSIYVPKALAAAIVGRNREVFGFADLQARSAESWDDVTVPTSVTLAVIAKAAGCEVADLKALNPHLQRDRTPPGGRYVVRVPRGGGERFATRFPQLRGDWDGYDAYVVAHGERFEDVATMFGLSRRRLMALNEVAHESEVTGGTVLVVPRVDAEERTRNLAKAQESLYASGVDQQAGEPLIVAVPDQDAHVEGKRRVFYRVVTGDSLDRIARAMKVKRPELARWNGLDAEARLHPRMILQAWVDPGWDAQAAKVALLDETQLLVVTRGSKEHLDLAEARVGRERIEYTAKKKESFEAVGKKFGLGARDLARINRRSHTTVLEPGETIVVYRVVDRTRSDRAERQWQATPREDRQGKQAAAKESTGQGKAGAASGKAGSAPGKPKSGQGKPGAAPGKPERAKSKPGAAQRK